MMKNWAGNIEYSSSTIVKPSSLEELSDIVRINDKVHAIGGCNSFNRIGDTEGVHILMNNFKDISYCGIKHEVTCQAGVSFLELCLALDGWERAILNLPTLTHISVVGGCTTGTHGSGTSNISSIVTAISIMDSEGEIVQYRKDKDDNFYGKIINFGCLGIVIDITLSTVPEYFLRQTVYQNLQFKDYFENFEDIHYYQSYSTSCFTDYKKDIKQVWVKDMDDHGPKFYGAYRQRKQLHPTNIDADDCTMQMGVLGKWFERLPLRGLSEGTLKDSERELQCEYFVDKRHAVESIERLKYLVNKMRYFDDILVHSEFRTVDSDQVWMSPAFDRDCVSLHFSWKPNERAVKKVIPLIENELDEFEPRAHWGKMFRWTTPHPMLHHFRRLMMEMDPEEKFRNDFVEDICQPLDIS